MDKQQIIKAILEKEWKMFHNVNGEERTSCQNNSGAFEGMRTAQYTVWSEKTCESWLEDITQAENEGRNVSREKYIYMMRSTMPDAFAYFSKEIPPLSENKMELVKEIWGIIEKQTEKMRDKYPLIAIGGRPMHASEETPDNTSIETYQTGELFTYSEKTLQSLLDDIRALEAEGSDYAYLVQENSVKAAGYASMEDAEQKMQAYAEKQREMEVDALLKENTGCPNCRMPGQLYR